MASIQKKGKQYYIVITVNGKIKWLPGKESKNLTIQYMDELINNQLSIITNKKDDDMTIKSFLNNWLSTYGKTNLKNTTYSGYNTYISKYINPEIGQVYLHDLSPLHVQNMYYELIENGRIKGDSPLSAKTIIQIHRILHKALKNAVQLQLLTYNPTDYVELPKKKKVTFDILKEKEIQPFLEAFQDTEYYLPVLLALSLGLRRGEVLALRWKDIDFNEKMLTINKSLTVADRTIKIDTPKNESSERRLLLPYQLINELIEYVTSDDDYICKTKTGKPWNPSTFSWRYSKFVEDNKLKKIRFHDLRHTNATLMYKSDIKLKVIQERLGHSNSATTLDIYTHLFKEDQNDAAEKLGVLIKLLEKTPKNEKALIK